jgi:hypothetical protein
MLYVPFPDIPTIYSRALGFIFGNRSGDFITRREGRLYPRGSGSAFPKPAVIANPLDWMGRAKYAPNVINEHICDMIWKI